MRKKSVLISISIVSILLFFFLFDARNLSDPIHDLGRLLIHSGMSVKHAITYCPALMKYGCIHGAIMEYLDTRSMNGKDAFAVCGDFEKEEVIYSNCVHGVGHFLFMKVAGMKESLSKCDQLKESVQPACFSGIFMEYALGAHHMHGYEVMYRHLPCDDLDIRYQRTCYASEGSYRQYRPGFETFKQSITYCHSIPSEYQHVCTAGVKEREHLSKLFH